MIVRAAEVAADRVGQRVEHDLQPEGAGRRAGRFDSHKASGQPRPNKLPLGALTSATVWGDADAERASLGGWTRSHARSRRRMARRDRWRRRDQGRRGVLMRMHELRNNSKRKRWTHPRAP